MIPNTYFAKAKLYQLRRPTTDQSTGRRHNTSGVLFKMGNCLKPVLKSEQAPHEEDEEEAELPLVISRVHDQVVLRSDECCKEKKKVRFKVQADNAAAVAMETTMTSPRMRRCVRVKVVLTQSELKQILNRATVYHHSPPSFSSFDDLISDRRMVKYRRSRCSWNPALQSIPEFSHY